MRSLSAAGRVTVSGSARDMQSLQEKHRAYLQSLQSKNNVVKIVREAEESRRKDQLHREQGFSCCFSGANATARKSSARRNSPGAAAGNGFFAARNACADGYGCSKWEERTVEIRGESGEVYAIRPCGERDWPRSLKDPNMILPRPKLAYEQAEERQSDCGGDAYSLWAVAAADQITSPCFDSPKSTLSAAAANAAKEEALSLLRAQRQTLAIEDPFGLDVAEEDEKSGDNFETEEKEHVDDESCEDTTQIDIVATATVCLEDVLPQACVKMAEPPCEENQDTDLHVCTHPEIMKDCTTLSSRQLVEPTLLADRIARLPAKWQASLLQMLEEAEAEASESFRSEAHLGSEGLTSPCNSDQKMQLAESNPSDEEIALASDARNSEPSPML